MAPPYVISKVKIKKNLRKLLHKKNEYDKIIDEGEK